MGDQQLWDQGLQGIKKVLAELPYANMMQLSDLLNDYRREKKALANVILQINSEVICRKCSGLCCLNGKYRINVLDLIALVVDGTLITPDFEQKPICPYGAVSGCLMEPGFRPTDCILFICDALDAPLPDAARSELLAREKTLRKLLNNASHLLSRSVATPLLLWSEKNSNLVNS